MGKKDGLDDFFVPGNKKEVDEIKDVRVSKRHFVVERANELLKNLMDTSMPDSQEISDEVASSVRVMEIVEYGRDRLPAGPAIEESDDIIIVEGRADVLTLLKNGFKNAIAINGTSVPDSIRELAKRKETTVFVDGDRGGDLIIKEILTTSEVDFVTKAPDGKEVEELTKKEIHKALRSRIAAEQVKMEMPAASPAVKQEYLHKQMFQKPGSYQARPAPAPIVSQKPMAAAPVFGKKAPVKSKLSDSEKKVFIDMLNDLVGTKGAYLLDQKLSILGKVPLTEVEAAVKSLGNINAVVFDGVIDKDTVILAERSNIKYLVAMDSKVKQAETSVNILTINDI